MVIYVGSNYNRLAVKGFIKRISHNHLHPQMESEFMHLVFE